MSDKRDIPVVGIAVGDLDALTQFLSGVPRDSGMAFLLAGQGRAFKQTSLAATVAGLSPLEIVEVQERAALRADTLYIAQRGRRLSLVADEIVSSIGSALLPADELLRALADEKQELAIAAILPGRGVAGTLGARAIRQHGGVVAAAQLEPGRAGMPANVIRAGLADIIAPCARLPVEMLSVFSSMHEGIHNEFDLAALAAGLHLDEFAPAGVLVDASGAILYLWGRTGDYLEPAPGRPNWNIAAMARAGLRNAAVLALAAAWKSENNAPPRHARLKEGDRRTVTLTARRVVAPELPFPMAMLGFRVPQRPAQAPGSQDHAG